MVKRFGMNHKIANPFHIGQRLYSSSGKYYGPVTSVERGFQMGESWVAHTDTFWYVTDQELRDFISFIGRPPSPEVVQQLRSEVRRQRSHVDPDLLDDDAWRHFHG